MIRSPTFSPAVPTKTPPLNFILPAARHSPPGARSPASPWRRDHAGRRPSSDPLRLSRSDSRQLDGAPLGALSIPDCWLLFTREGKKHPLLVEIDLGTEHTLKFKQ